MRISLAGENLHVQPLSISSLSLASFLATSLDSGEGRRDKIVSEAEC